MSALHASQIAGKLKARFSQHIDLSDLAHHTDPKALESSLLTRAQAAFALTILTDIDDGTAAAHVCDGHGDNGLDAVYYNEEEQVLYVVQSKWHEQGSGTIDQGDALKFLSGFKELIGSEKDKFNAKLIKHWDAVERSLHSLSRIVLCIVHTGTKPIADVISAKIKSDLDAINDTSELVSLKVLDQAALYSAIALGAEGDPVNFDVLLLDWGTVDTPFVAFYGRVAASDISSWLNLHGRRLLAKNIRAVITDSSVNERIAETIKQTPEQFWYFNNGITVLCEDIQRKLLGAGERSQGVFSVRGASIVNGAQTAGAIARTIKPGESSRAMVLVRFISLAQCPPQFAADVTRATNTQNRVENRDFAALDPVHERLRQELLVDQKEYLYKTGEKAADPARQCTIDEVTVALACADDDIATSTIAKNSVGKLWENTNAAPYKKLFNPSLSIHRLWNAVETLRAVDSALRGIKGDKVTKNIAIHGNRFVAHRVFSELGAKINDDNFVIDASSIETRVSVIVTRIQAILVKEHPSAYIGVFFKNQQRCRDMNAKLS